MLFGRRHRARKASAATEQKASRTGPLIALHREGRPVWTPRDYAALAREGYQKNPIVFRSVRLIAEAAASVPWVLYAGKRACDDHPLLQLLAQPNEREAGTAFLQSVYGHLLVAGNAYVEAISLGNTVRELHVLRPDRVKVVPGANGWPEAYTYQVAGRTVRFDMLEGDTVAPILHVKSFHPLNDHYGFSPLEAAQVSLDVHNAASAWNKALLDNSARPSGALIYQGRDGAHLSQEQFTRLKAELENTYQSTRNAGRPLLLEGGLDWKTMALSPRDMDFMGAKNGAAREIALAFGVPPMMLGIPGDNTYANYQEANRAFWLQTVLPLVRRLGEALAGWLAADADPAIRIAYDADALDALSHDRERLWSRVGAADYLSVNEKRAAVGYGNIDGGDGAPHDLDTAGGG